MMNRPPIPWIILIVSLLLTIFAAWQSHEYQQAREEARFQNAVEATTAAVDARIKTYIAMLRGGVGLFAAGGDVTYAEFQRYADHMNLPTRYPGIQGVGFTQHFRVEEQDSLIRAMVDVGFEDFHVWPELDAAQRDAIVYLQPTDDRNLAALGYDMFSESVRQFAMARARDTGAPSISGRVTLVQEIDGRTQAGFLIYLPVYRGGVDPIDLHERRRLLHGYVYSPFRADDLLAGIFATQEQADAAFRIYDGRELDPELLLHDSRINGINPAPGAAYDETVSQVIAGHEWTFSFAHTDAFSSDASRWSPWVILLVGGILSTLVAALSATQVQAERAALRSESRLRAVLEALPLGVSVAERDGQIAFSNSASRRIWGTSAENEMVRSSERPRRYVGDDRMMHPDEWALNRALKGESIEASEIQVDAPDGSPIILLNSAVPILGRKGEIELVVASEVDITRRMHAEDKLREREREFRTMVDSIPQLAWMADGAGQMIWYNQRWIDFIGESMTSLRESGWQHHVHPDHVRRVVERIQRSFASGDAWEDTFPIRDASGEYRHFLYRAVPIHGELGDIFRWFGTGTDITEQMLAREADARAIREQVAREAAEQREEQLRRHASELERSNRELQDFAYVASHDLQEPLRKISTFTELVLDEYGEIMDDDASSYLVRVKVAAVRMSRLIKDLLEFSRVETQGRPFEEVDLNDILDDVLADLEVLRHESGAEVDVGFLPVIEADPMQMRQLFQNLLGNALKFQRNDQPVHVIVRSSRIVPEGLYADGVADHDPRCRIEVVDHGVGFEEKYLDRIFSPFQRLHGRSEYEGTGIGLAICRRIVERHDGMITAQSKPGVGSTFIVELPLRQEHEVGA